MKSINDVSYENPQALKMVVGSRQESWNVMQSQILTKIEISLQTLDIAMIDK